MYEVKKGPRYKNSYTRGGMGACSEIKPIETIYDGYRFRSRLEARWAVFFNTAGIRYRYEPEGFMLSDGSWYLPDFYLPDVGGRAGENGLWVEVKGQMSEEALRKAELFFLH